MAKTVVGLYEMRSQAESAIQDLVSEGFSRQDIHLKSGDEVISQSSEQEQGFISGWRQFLADIGLISEERQAAPQGIHPDDSVVVVETADQMSDKASDIMNRHGALDIDDRIADLHAEKRGAGIETRGAPEIERGTESREEAKIPVVEEELQVGKREVSRGGARVYAEKTEHPVEREVSLREERVHVEREPVSRPATEEELEGFEEGVIEVKEEAEEPVVAKKARVKEEVTVGKETVERPEVIRETLRGTEVHVEPLSPEEQRAFGAYENDFRNDYEVIYAKQGMSFDDIRPAYEYGYHLGQDPRFHDGEWSNVAPKIRQDWEAHHYGAWEPYEHAVRSGWERAVHH